ncbi:MAG: non-canonical purine NTP pyrophosphatase, partial [Chloroflexota bacterium]
ALVWPGGAEDTFHGAREGYVTKDPRGNNGFGYDPVFFLPELGKTLAELPPEVKNQWSHRAEAAGKAVQRLQKETIVARLPTDSEVKTPYRG